MTEEDAAAATGLTVEAVRRYREAGLVTPDPQSGAYDDWRLAQLALVKRAVDLGVDEKDCAQLLRFFDANAEATSEMTRRIEAQAADLETTLEELRALSEASNALSGPRR